MTQCQFCGKPATVHVTQMVNNKTSVAHLCDECAAKQGLFTSGGLPFSMLVGLGETLMSGLKQHSAISGLICSKCGCTPMAFKETGRLGCANCYKDLNILINSLIETSQKGMEHNGKKPKSHTRAEVEKAKLFSGEGTTGTRKKKNTTKCSQLDDLQAQLEKAVKEEKYEQAAQLRDEIKQLKGLKDQKGSHE